MKCALLIYESRTSLSAEKVSRGTRAKRFLFLARLRGSLFRRKSSGRRRSLPKQDWSKLRRVPRFASRHNAHISVDAAAVHIFTSFTNIRDLFSFPTCSPCRRRAGAI